MDMEGEKVLKRTRTEPEEEAKEDAQFRQTKRLMQRREADWDVGSSSSSSRSCWQGNSNKKFEVFISHRGPDTKETLARHIYDLLRDRGVGVFLDLEELQAGEMFPEAIKEAIQCSRVHLCILSSGYTESVWCLRELEMMMHRYEIRESEIIPIFYDVEPAEVRRLEGAMGQGMEKQIQRYPSEVEQWRDALRKIADISGYEGKGAIAMEVTARICQLLDVGSLATSSKVVGIWNQVEGLKDGITRRRKEGHDVTSVEITGIGGIGKTTFAKILYDNIRSGYTRSCFIDDVGGVVEKKGVNAVHKQIISDLFRYDPNLSESSGKQFLKSRLANEEILIVLDNINKENCVSAVFIEDDVSLRATSTIIVTSREQGVLQYDPDISRYRRNLIALQISKLPFEVSKELFCRYAFEGSRCCFDPQQDDLMNKIIKKCDGIPLALALFGKHVYGKDLKFWENFWASIEHTLPPDITKILRFTYDHLDTDLEKCLFLDVAIFFRGESVDLLRNIRGGESDEDDGKVSVALINLERKLLIDTRNHCLNMHDLLVDLGRTIVMDESSCPGRRSSLWHPSDVRKLLSEERGTDKVKGLSLVWRGSAVLDEDENGNPCAWSADVFGGMSSMELLILKGNCIEGDFSKLSRKLLWLRWTDFPFESIPRTLCIKRLRKLDLRNAKRMTHLWEHSSREAPRNLRELNVVNCRELQRLPEFIGKFRRLSSIVLDGCESLEHIPDTFGQLQGLKHLELWSCGALQQLPETIGYLNSLIELQIEDCSKLKLLPMSLGKLGQLQKLRLCQCNALEELPQTFGDLIKLQLFEASSCSELKSLPSSFSRLPQISGIFIGRCQNLAIDEDQFEQITSLRDLELFGCKVPKLPRQVGQQNHLRNLRVWNNRGSTWSHHNVPSLASFSETEVEELSLNTENLKDLRFLHLENISFTHLPVSMENLTALRKLHLRHCFNLRELPESVAKLSRLTDLLLEGCPRLRQLPSCTGNLSDLRELSITGCCDLTQLPESIGRLSSLGTLLLHNCWNLQELPAAIEKLSNLRVLSVYKCRNLQVLPMLKGRCPNFQDLPYTVDNSRRKVAVKVFPDCYACTKGSPRRKANFITLTRPKELPNLESLVVSGCMKNQKHIMRHSCYKPPIPDDIIHQFHKLNRLSLSPSHGHGIDYNYENLEDLDPANVVTLMEDQCWFHFIGRTYSSSSISGHFIPNPKYSYTLSQSEKGECFRLSQGKTMLMCVQVEDFQEQVMVRKLHSTDKQSMAERGSIDDDEEFPGYTAVVQEEGGVISLTPFDRSDEFFLREQKKHPLYSGFHVDIPTSPWRRIWKQIPIHIWGLSALDIANCNITNKYSHCSTCLMEEETGLTWKRRMRLFYDDHALELLRKESKFRHVAVSVSGCDLQTVADVCETCVSVVSYDQMGKSKVVQTYLINRTLQAVPSYLYWI